MGEEEGGGDRRPAQEERLSRRRRRRRHCIFTTLCRGMEKRIIIPLLIKFSCVAACRPVARRSSCAPLRANTAASYRRKNMMHGAPCGVKLASCGTPWLMPARADYPHVHACVPHTCEIETFSGRGDTQKSH